MPLHCLNPETSYHPAVRPPDHMYSHSDSPATQPTPAHTHAHAHTDCRAGHVCVAHVVMFCVTHAHSHSYSYSHTRTHTTHHTSLDRLSTCHIPPTPLLPPRTHGRTRPHAVATPRMLTCTHPPSHAHALLTRVTPSTRVICSHVGQPLASRAPRPRAR